MANNDLVRSVLRSFKILGLVAQSERGMTLQEICDLLQYNKSTTYSLVRTLIARNFLERTAAPVRYRRARALPPGACGRGARRRGRAARA